VALMKYAKFHICCFIIYSILKEEYTESEIVKKFDYLQSIIQDDSAFLTHLADALKSLKEVLQTYAGNKNKDVVFSLTKQSDFDKKIVKFIHQKKS
jgi:hypothetical protein